MRKWICQVRHASIGSHNTLVSDLKFCSTLISDLSHNHGQPEVSPNAEWNTQCEIVTLGKLINLCWILFIIENYNLEELSLAHSWKRLIAVHIYILFLWSLQSLYTHYALTPTPVCPGHVSRTVHDFFLSNPVCIVAAGGVLREPASCGNAK